MMTSIRDIFNFLDKIAPFDSQADDNSGLQIGDFASAVERAMVCLDATPQVIAQAAGLRCNLVVAHHQVIFHARKQLLSSDPAWLLARHGIACIASHAPLDCCPGGVNDLLVRRLGLGEAERWNDFIRLINLPESITTKALADLVAQKLGAHVRYCDAGKPITRAAICGGGGCHFLDELYGHADAYVTGDAGHHNFVEAAQHGLSLLAAGHFETEIQIVPALTERLRAAFPDVKWHAAEEHGVLCHAA
jgi:dinuclear metal center YbgI/SA1388 family protein